MIDQAQQSNDKARNEAINNLALVIAQALGSGTGISGSAGAATGTFLTIVGPDGEPYKIALRSPS